MTADDDAPDPGVRRTEPRRTESAPLVPTVNPVSRLQPDVLRLILVSIDVAVSSASLALGGVIANQVDPIPFAAVRLIAIVWFVGLPMAGLFRERNSSRPRVEATRGVLVAAGTLISLAVAGNAVGVVSLRAAVIVIVTLLLGWLASRALVRVTVGALREAGHLQRAVVIATAVEYLDDLRDLLQVPTEAGYRVVGHVGFQSHFDVPTFLDTVVREVRSTHASGVVISPLGIDPDLFHEIVHELSPRGVHVEIQLPIRTLAEHRIKVTRLGRGFSLYLKPPRHTLAQRIAKRSLDLVLSGLLLLVMAPVFLVIAIAIKWSSPGPVFFVQERIGRFGRPFGMVKFRSMAQDAEERLDEVLERNEAVGPLFKIPHDPRITRVGRFLRRLSLDELPQLWNVLKGEMSLVGPRPALEQEMLSWPQELHARLDVAPGMTGMWQVYRSRTDYGDDYLRLDLHYVRNWTLANDIGLILRTIPAMFTGRGET